MSYYIFVFSNELKEKQRFISEFFERVLEKNFLSRAYLLVGSALDDKKLLVKELNQILNCDLNKAFIDFNREQNSGESLFAQEGLNLGIEVGPRVFPFQAACGECQNCKWIAEDTHPRTPINIVGSTEKKKLVDVKDLRENILPKLIQNSEFFRIVIIEDAHSNVLTKDPATTLLKTIEEAKPNTMFMLFADQEDRVLNTIKSRSQVLKFNSKNEEEFSEEAIEKFNELRESLINIAEQGKLALIQGSEAMAEIKSEILIEILYIFESEIMAIGGDPILTSKKIFEIEKTIQSLKSFVRPKSEIYNLSKELQKL